VSRRALIGSTGFVGGNLARQADFDDCYHSRNAGEMAGRRYDLVVCAGAPGWRWLANREPDADRANLERLMRDLATVRADRVLLISSIDVYPRPVEVDESTPIDPDAGQPYGRHRFALERFVGERFATTVVRLPGLFGPGLKKNVVFDLLHGKPTDGLSGASRQQYYDAGRLWKDLERALALGLDLVNFATEPVAVGDIARHAFGIEYPPVRPDAEVARYDLRSRHAEAFGGRGWYFEDRATVLDRLAAFVASEGWRRPGEVES
jgi:nucleoside-diphosphate-sugar epimerase